MHPDLRLTWEPRSPLLEQAGGGVGARTLFPQRPEAPGRRTNTRETPGNGGAAEKVRDRAWFSTPITFLHRLLGALRPPPEGSEDEAGADVAVAGPGVGGPLWDLLAHSCHRHRQSPGHAPVVFTVPVSARRRRCEKWTWWLAGRIRFSQGAAKVGGASRCVSRRRWQVCRTECDAITVAAESR